jgi:hypothetical protein
MATAAHHNLSDYRGRNDKSDCVSQIVSLIHQASPRHSAVIVPWAQTKGVMYAEVGQNSNTVRVPAVCCRTQYNPSLGFKRRW